MAEFREDTGRDEDSPEAWVHEQLSFVDESGNRVCRFRIEGKELRTDRWRTLVNAYRKADDTAATLTERLSKQAERARVRYVQVSAWFARGKVPVSLFGEWPVEVPDDIDIDDDTDATPMSVHRDATTMLHEAGARMYRQASQNNDRLMHALLAMVRANLDNSHERLKAHEDERNSLMDERMTLLDAYRTIAVERDSAVISKDRFDTALQMGKTVTDAVAFRLTHGVHAKDSKYDTIVRIIGGLGESLDDKQRKSLDDILSPHQLSAIVELFSDADGYVDKVEKARERKQAKATENNKQQAKKKPRKKAQKTEQEAAPDGQA